MNYIETLEAQLEGMARSFIAALPSIAIAIIVLVVTWVVARIAVSMISRMVGRARVREDLKQLVQTLVKLGVWLTGLMIAATIILPGMTAGGLIAGLGVGAVAIGFAFQDIFENFLAGVLIMLREKMQIGDMVEANGILGKVEKITLRETHIRHYSGELTILPNSMVFKNAVKIYTDATQRRNDIVVGVSYDTDLEKAEKVIRQAVERIDKLAPGKGVDVYAQEFNSSSVDFLVRWWIDITQQDFLGVKSEVVFAIKQALDDADIEIPFPYVTHTFKEAIPLAQPRNDAA
ncbi:mechanosensitive ion channel family protein [Altericroceibacterium spongiae]|uniref:Small-conductance mechanosensitive channel n=1 Tax=Altericroceibacterium spongiae TaxID=2320269 RepID=A0A420EKM6_9SPHN|nr:mechanosensitive ion channel [Altericroceibacterium spongiae]RKF21281.1 mechanosensitive ion channel family protein [Altericroceibacterium spongiae]